MTQTGIRDQIRSIIYRYFDGCNEANAQKMMACFAPDAIHYFPDGAPQGPFIGAVAISQGWKNAVQHLGSIWTIDHLLIDEEAGEAVIEWTHFKPALASYLRGDEWYRFNDQGLITEIRAYYACPPVDPRTTNQLGGFDYAGRGYPKTAPVVARHPD